MLRLSIRFPITCKHKNIGFMCSKKTYFVVVICVLLKRNYKMTIAQFQSSIYDLKLLENKCHFFFYFGWYLFSVQINFNFLHRFKTDHTSEAIAQRNIYRRQWRRYIDINNFQLQQLVETSFSKRSFNSIFWGKSVICSTENEGIAGRFKINFNFARNELGSVQWKTLTRCKWVNDSPRTSTNEKERKKSKRKLKRNFSPSSFL